MDYSPWATRGVDIAGAAGLSAENFLDGQSIRTAWNATAAALSYYHLRSLKESVGVEDVAAVFD